MSFITVQNLKKTYIRLKQPLVAIEDINIEILKGSIVAVVGPSGCGKTTFLRILAGLIDPTQGKVEIEGKSPKEYRDNGGIGFVFQKATLFPWRNLRKNLLLPTEIVGDNKIDSVNKCNELLDLVGLSGFNEFYPKELSGGMLQRAALARALMNDPHLLLLDEPFSAVDEITREQLWVDFWNIWKKKDLTVVIVTHNIREAIFLSDKVYVMSKLPGKIVENFKVEIQQHRNLEVISGKQFIELYNEIRKSIT